MTIVGSARLALLGAVGAVAVALPAAAQEGAISRCNALATDAERVACLTEALRATGVEPGASAPQPAATQAVAPAAAPAPMATIPATTAPAATASAAVTTAATSTPEREREGWGLRVPFFGGRDDDEEPAPVAMSAADAEEFGAGALQAREQAAPEVLMATVVSSEVVGYNQLQVALDNGQVWRQTQADESWDPFLHDDPRSVQIHETPMGGFRMQVDELTKTLLVERVR